ncbi:MAG TPA: PDZ domain-containing protein [Candidatus Acidoferrum sp.]|nr:PDZ domain-containing protein [Candidatus Acidoferrum sp.]
MFPAIPCILFVLIFGVPCRATIQYAISLDHPEEHLFHVTMTIPDVAGEVTVQMAAWDALYQIRDFSQRVQRIEASVGSDPAPVEKVDKQTWHIKGTGVVKVSYATYWDEVGPFASQLNAEHAFINPAMILMYVPARRNEAVHLSMPDVPGQWQVASPSVQFLGSMGGGRNFGGDASNYDVLADAPIEAGKFEKFQLTGIKPEIWVLIHGDNWRKKQVADDLKRICQYELKLMAGAPFDHYLFILHIGKGAGGGGMEHANSTAIGVGSDEYLPGVAAHEFFHLWNVKRIRPTSLESVDRSKEQYTRALWFAEGVTNTYGSYTLVRSGIWGKEQFYADLAEQITEMENRPANRWQSAEQSSLDAWLEKYPLYNQPEYSVSYYTKGQVLGDLLDILIRDRTDNEKSLDDVLRAMNGDFAKQGKAYRDSLDVRLTVEKIAGSSFEEFFQKYVAGTEPLPYQKVLALAGLHLKSIEHRRPTLGFFSERDASGALVVKSVDPGGPAAQAGLREDDAIIGWNGGEAPRRVDWWLHEQKAGDLLKLRIRREAKESTIEFRLGEIKETIYEVIEALHPSEKAGHIRDGILHGVTSAAPVR